jgi:flagellar hook assembly protein FlgD
MSSTSAANIQMDYMKLLITELQNQNPLEPLSNEQMASQLTQFSQLQQLESMSSSFAEILASNTRTYAHSLLGKEVSYIIQDPMTGAVQRTWGAVSEVFDVGGENYLVIDRHVLGLQDIGQSLVGKQISFYADGTQNIESGIVYGVHNDSSGPTGLIMEDGRVVEFKDVIADSLVGQYISFTLLNEETGALENKTCKIDEVKQNADGGSLLVVGNYLDLEDVISVRN